MPDDHPGNNYNEPRPHKTFFERLAAFILPEPESQIELLDILNNACERSLIDADCLSMLQGVFRMNDLTARDLMVPRSQMYTVDITKPVDTWLPMVMESGHSRFPAYADNLDNIVGVVLTKDLLAYFTDPDFTLEGVMRPAVFIPESKRANILLKDFRDNHNHMAIVIDEYGNIAGLITIEDVLEQIVGDIEDEFDDDEETADIRVIGSGGNISWRVSALTELETFNLEIGTSFHDDNVDTIGGYITQTLGRIPHTGDVFDIGSLHFTVMRADTTQVHVLMVERRPEGALEKDNAVSA